MGPCLLEGRSTALPHIAIATDYHDLAINHDIGRPHQTIKEGMAIAIEVVDDGKWRRENETTFHRMKKGGRKQEQTGSLRLFSLGGENEKGNQMKKGGRLHCENSNQPRCMINAINGS